MSFPPKETTEAISFAYLLAAVLNVLLGVVMIPMCRRAARLEREGKPAMRWLVRMARRNPFFSGDSNEDALQFTASICFINGAFFLVTGLVVAWLWIYWG